MHGHADTQRRRAFQLFCGARGQLVVPAGGEALQAERGIGDAGGAGNEESGGNEDLL